MKQMSNQKKKRLLIPLLLALFLYPCLHSQAYTMSSTKHVTPIAAGTNCSAAIDKDGSLWMWGSNTSGQLGTGTHESSLIPIKVLEDVTAVCTGNSFTAVIRNDNSLWMWGSNAYGQLGNGTTENSLTPIKVLDDVTAISMGESFAAAIRKDGSLWMWGNNTMGQLGNGRKGNATNDHGLILQTVPIEVIQDVTAVCAGSGHSAALKADGSLWMWGDNSYGQLGIGEITYANGRWSNLGKASPTKVMEDVTSVCVGKNYTAAIKTDGSLWMWGDNTYGQLGNGKSCIRKNDSSEPWWHDHHDFENNSWDTLHEAEPIMVLENVSTVNAGTNHTVAIKEDGSLWTWGNNINGQLGIEKTVADNGTDNSSNSEPVKILDNVAAASAGASFTLITKIDGTVWAWGCNISGQLGNGTWKNSDTPLQVSDIITCIP